ncbi:DUF669 domain-containing protein [Cloacibacillus porcorum]|uniref:DUF669 domain-containing protein n=1 Tax=Cloacibacillus porcorum TaxID=1197717 RepID=UPI003F01C7B7
MALLGNDVTQDLVNVKPEDFSPLPAGEYILQITKTEQKKTKDGTGAYISITFDVIGPSYQGRKIFCNLNFRNNSPAAEKIGRQQLKALQLACAIPDPFMDDQQLIGHIVKASVTVREATEKYPASNDVKNFKPVGDAMPTGAPMGMPPMPSAAPVGDAVTPPQGANFSQAFAQPPQTPAPQTAPDAAAGAPKWW